MAVVSRIYRYCNDTSNLTHVQCVDVILVEQMLRPGNRQSVIGSVVAIATRQALQADLQQCNAYDPVSEKSKKMIKDMGNVELFELCETIPKVQCKECLLYWIQAIVYCTCGHLLRENKSSRGILQWTLDLLSIPNHIIKKERLHGHRYGKTKE